MAKLLQSQDWMLFGSTMDNATCNIIYVDGNVHRDGVVHNSDILNGFSPECEFLSANLRLLRDVFSDSMPISTLSLSFSLRILLLTIIR